MHVRGSIAIDAFLELKLELRKERRYRQLTYYFDECLTDTDSATAQKRRKTARITSLTLRSQEVGALRIEALWNELFWLSPFILVVADAGDVDCDHVPFPDLKFLTLDSLRHAHG